MILFYKETMLFQQYVMLFSVLPQNTSLEVTKILHLPVAIENLHQKQLSL